MKVMMLTGIRQMEMMKIPVPQIERDNDVLIRMKRLGVCGSDIHYYTTGRIGSQVVHYPFPVGHEGAGIVEKTGSGVTHVKPGDRVAIEPAMPCWQCDQCLADRSHTCRNLKFLGCPGQANGCLSEYIVMPETSCLPIPENMTLDQACISEPLAIGVYAVQQSVPIKNAVIGILGFGPMGMSVLLPALAWGAKKAYVTDKINKRLLIASKTGATWTGNPDKKDIVHEIKQQEPLLLDAVFECCGRQEAMDQAVELLKPGGKIMIIGIPEFDYWYFNVNEIRRKEITVQNVRRQNNCAKEAIEMIASGMVNINPMVTHRFRFEKTKDAFDLVAEYRNGVMKAMIDFGE
jgi:L-iditol 2-dehydrogenase